MEQDTHQGSLRCSSFNPFMNREVKTSSPSKQNEASQLTFTSYQQNGLETLFSVDYVTIQTAISAWTPSFTHQHDFMSVRITGCKRAPAKMSPSMLLLSKAA